jgi:hypothetical protein
MIPGPRASLQRRLASVARGLRYRSASAPLRRQKEHTMPVLLWLLGVPLGLIVVLWLLGIIR